jgi:hypothetical protein
MATELYAIPANLSAIVDELGAVKEQISVLEEHASKLKAPVVAQGVGFSVRRVGHGGRSRERGHDVAFGSLCPRKRLS